MVDSFFAIPETQSSSFSPSASPFIDSPILPNTGLYNPLYGPPYGPPLGLPQSPLYGPPVYPYIYPKPLSVVPPNSFFYYDSGIGSNPLVQHDIAKDIRYRFLDKWLYDSDDILRMLRIDQGKVQVIGGANKNDISNDTEQDLIKKSDYIGDNILPLHKVKKILFHFTVKNNIKFYDIPYNEHHIKKTIVKYVLKKLRQLKDEK